MFLGLADLTDLAQWATRVEARADLPILLRRLILATTGADYFRAPGGDAVGDPGWDVVVDAPSNSSPWIPDGSSRWEGGVSADIERKAQSDFRKRTAATPEDDQARQTFVFFTPLQWDQDSKDAWIERRQAQESAHWRAVRVLDGTDLISWLETQPAVHIWLSERMGHRPTEVQALARWWESWSTETSPALPATLLTAGRERRARELVAALRGSAAVHVVASQSREESRAFVAATLSLEDAWASELGGAEPDPEPEDSPEDGQRAPEVSAAISGVENDDGAPSVGPDETAMQTAASAADSEDTTEVQSGGPLMAAAVLVHSAEAWARLAVHPGSLVLVPTYEAADTDRATRSGHHVVLAVSSTAPAARVGQAEVLPRISTAAGRVALSEVGVESFRADELARAARLNLTGLRRRISRVPVHQDPPWASGTAAETLVPLLLVGGWDETRAADLRCLEVLTDSSWRSLSRALQSVLSAEDSPVRVEAGKWQLTDAVDAWQLLAPRLTALDLRELPGLVSTVLSERDPKLALPVEERWSAGVYRIGFEHSPGLRSGVVQAVALLATVVGDAQTQDGLSGQDHADRAVHQLLESDDPEHWLSVADLLPELAEGSPTEFLRAAERIVSGDAIAARALFEPETENSLFHQSRHVHLLWALERLTFSRRHVSRALLVLARLAEIDPGGRSLNRPLESIGRTLDLVVPVGAVDSRSRAETLGLIGERFPDVAWALMTKLVPSRVGHVVMSGAGPRWRDWPSRTGQGVTLGQVTEAIGDLIARLVAAMGQDADRIVEMVELVQDLPPTEVEVVVGAIRDALPCLDPDERASVAAALARMAGRHREFPQAVWALGEGTLAQLEELALELDPTVLAVAASEWFAYWPRPQDIDDDDPDRDQVVDRERRAAVVAALETGGLPAVVALAEASEASYVVGQYLARIDHEYDRAIAAMIETDGPNAPFVNAYVHARATDAGTGWIVEQLACLPRRSRAAFLVRCPVDAALLEVLDSSDEEVQLAYWENAPSMGIPRELVPDYIGRLLEHDRPWTALAVLSALRQSLDGIDESLLVRVLDAPLQGTTQVAGDWVRDLDSTIQRVLGTLFERDFDVEVLARLEFYYLSFTRRSFVPRGLHRALETRPRTYVELVAAVHPSGRELAQVRTDDEPGTATDDPKDAGSEAAGSVEESEGVQERSVGRDPRIAPIAYSVLQGWPGLPSYDSDGVAVEGDLAGWVDEVLGRLDAADRAHVAVEAVANALSSLATDPDGTWPSRQVREIVERLADEEFDDRLRIARYNRDQMSTRGFREGDRHERAQSSTYQKWADRVRGEWPRTAGLLDDMAGALEREARWRDRFRDR